TYLAGLIGSVVVKGLPVICGPKGQLGLSPSSRRFKKDIHTMGAASDKFLQLRPVTFRYKKAAEDGTYPLQYGLIAEEVARVYPEMVGYDRAGKPFSVYYQLLTPMLLNELQKQHRQALAQKSEIAILKIENAQRKSEVATLKSALNKQRAELASLKQAQKQQLQVLAKLAASLPSAQQTHPAAYVQH
ncbi:MAG TPA: tail fiber domain-containing protein, partial [Chthonomonadaceae bacterium]|nr:tail fiber domain-containing protein [Chthonomonadaceae bacterium]